MIFRQLLTEAIRTVESHFIPDELAYLALTQKVEQAFRDKLAFILHKKMEKEATDLIVCREWIRADLAILKDSNPVVILEAKAGYTFDILMEIGGYNFPRLVSDDLEKAARLASRFKLDASPEIYALVIATHPHDAPDIRFADAIKYYRKVVLYANPQNNAEAIQNAMNDRMRDFKLVDTHCVNGGSAFGVQVSVYVWLYRAQVLEEEVSQEVGEN